MSLKVSEQLQTQGNMVMPNVVISLEYNDVLYL